MRTGKLITLEGTEGAGKSTALNFIREEFAKHGVDVLLTREPGGTLIAEEVRHVLLYSKQSETMSSSCELLLMFAARAQHIQHVILPALNAGRSVLCDRYIDASYAYQGGGRGVDTSFISDLDQRIVGDVYPDLTLLLDLPPEMGLMRTLNRHTAKDRIEQEKVDFFHRVRDAYLQRASQDPGRIKVIDASRSLPEVEASIRTVLQAFVQRTLA